MLKAFGGQNTWSQKAVYVKLPGGTWTIGSTHDMPHMSGSIKDNNFNGHLCVHFLRTMSEAQQNDPSYGVSNQNTIRSFWNPLGGGPLPVYGGAGIAKKRDSVIKYPLETWTP